MAVSAVSGPRTNARSMERRSRLAISFLPGDMGSKRSHHFQDKQAGVVIKSNFPVVSIKTTILFCPLSWLLIDRPSKYHGAGIKCTSA